MVPYRALSGFFDKCDESPDWNSVTRINSYVERINQITLLPYTLGKSGKLKKKYISILRGWRWFRIITYRRFIKNMRRVLEIIFIQYGQIRSFIERVIQRKYFIIFWVKTCSQCMIQLEGKGIRYGRRIKTRLSCTKSACWQPWNNLTKSRNWLSWFLRLVIHKGKYFCASLS